MKDWMLRDKIVFSVTDKMQELHLDLQKAINICRAHELTSKQTKDGRGTH